MTNQMSKVDLIFKSCSVADALKKISSMNPADIVSSITDSGIKGRGGAGFPTGMKWKFAAEQKGDKKYVVCNADEGEPGTFKDRAILEKVPEKVFLGMLAGAKAIGSDEGYIYLRGEYTYMVPALQKALDDFNKQAAAAGFKFKIHLHMGAGAYVCGEETALIESMEGKRGEPRNKPPFPVVAGFMNKPTIVNNVETLVYCMMIAVFGADEFKKYGTKDSKGGKVFSVSGDTPKAGIYELGFGMKLSDFVAQFGDGDTKAVQVGGASGFCVPRKHFEETIIGFEGIPTGGSMMLFNSSRSMFRVLKNYMDFFAEESCGQCTPCRIGCQHLLNGIELVKKGEKPASYLENLRELADTMRSSSKCGLGQSVPNAFISILDNFREEILY